MAKRHHPFVWFLLIIVLIGLTFGCNGNELPEATPETPQPTHLPAKISVIPSSTTLPAIVTPTVPVPTKTRVIIPSPTPKITHTVTTISTSTVPTEQVKAWISKMLRTNDNCQLPCWWGITPGKNTWDETVSLMSPYATEIIQVDNRPGAAIFKFVPKEIPKDVWLGLDFKVEDNLVRGISVSPSINTPDLYLPTLLSELGIPGEVWIQAYSDWPCDYGGIYSPGVYVIYPEQGVFAQYDSSISENRDGIIYTCMGNGPILKLWSPEYESPTIKDLYSDFPEEWSEKPPRPVQEALGMTPQQFYDKFRDVNQQACFTVQKKLWQYCGVTTTP
jgi:hypothetical protein